MQENQEMFFQLFECAPDAILVVDRTGDIILVNAQVEAMFGYQRSELVGQPVEILIPERFSTRHAQHRFGYLAEPPTHPMWAGWELFGRRKDGSEFPVDIMLSPLETPRGPVVLDVVRDITERKQAEEDIKEALRREMLLRRELHHRVKNNLQVISSLLFLQSLSVTNPEVLDILEEGQNRVKAVALIHEKLYHSGDLTKIPFSDYIQDLVKNLFSSYSARSHSITSRITGEGVLLDIDAAIPCGLIINELVSNSLKHAFPQGGKGEVVIHLLPTEDGKFTLTVHDNGVGLPSDFDPQRADTLGLTLVNDLSKQLGGVIEFDRSDGTTVRITFADIKDGGSSRL